MNGPDPIKHPGELISGDFTTAEEPFALFAAWFAEAVERRYRRCLAAAPAASAPATSRGGAV